VIAAHTSALALLPDWLQAETILSALGPYMLLGACLIIFAECGLLIGFFLPGDSLLFTAGLFVSQQAIDTPLWLACVLLVLCAFGGNVCGYWIGRSVGPALFNKPDSKLFKQEYVDKTHEFFERYGARAIILARFVPIVRTFITAIAGVGRMQPRRYFTHSAIGAVIWAAGITIMGYFLGQITWIRNNLEPVIIMIVALSVVPIVVEYIRSRRANRVNSSESS